MRQQISRLNAFYFLAEHVFAKFATHLNFCLFFDFLDSSWFPCNAEKKYHGFRPSFENKSQSFLQIFVIPKVYE